MKATFLHIEDFNVIQDEFIREQNKYYEGILTQGNGYFHIRGTFEEGLTDAPQDESYVRTMKSVTTEMQRHPLSKQGTFIPLIMGRHQFLEEVIVNLPYFMAIQLYSGSEKLDMIRSTIKNFSRVLNMKTGELVRKFVWETEAGEKIAVEFKRFASMKRERLCVQKVSFEVLEGTPALKIVSGIDGSVTTNGHCHFTERSFAEKDGQLWYQVKTDMEEAVEMLSYNCLTGMEASKETEEYNQGIYQSYRGQLECGRKVEFVKYTVLGCSRDKCEDYSEEVRNCMKNAVEFSYEDLQAESAVIWEKRWEESYVRIDGDEQLQNGMNFSIYHLIRSNTGIEDRIQVCAKGFAGEAYYGRYFWDTEMYMLPFYLYTKPEIAKSLLMYRYLTLDGARENAARYNCKGARYPWQSALTGTEQCSMWEYADNEVHVTADIAYAVMNYYHVTGDKEFLFNYGIEILVETAKFWTDRTDRDKDGIYHLLNVMGPDEYSPMTKDNGFTTRMVRYNLESAINTLALVKEEDVEQYNRIVERTGLTQEDLQNFEAIKETLPIPYDAERDLYLQSADFEEYAQMDLNDVWEDKNRAFAHYVTQEKIYRTRCIKQADTIALMSIFGGEFTDHQVEVAYDYYKPMTTHDSSLSPAVHTLIANRIGRDQEVRDFVTRTLAVDLQLERKGAEDGIHIANCGALWQMAVQGFLGMIPAYESEKLEFEPKLPSFINEIETQVVRNGKKYKVCATKNGVKVEERNAE